VEDVERHDEVVCWPPIVGATSIYAWLLWLCLAAGQPPDFVTFAQRQSHCASRPGTREVWSQVTISNTGRPSWRSPSPLASFTGKRYTLPNLRLEDGEAPKLPS
jgi:hypothetical protein